MKTKFPYTSLHHYLDTVLSSIDNPSRQQIKDAKRDYWKLYYKFYRREKRKYRKEFTLGFKTDELHKIKNKKGKLSVSEYLYQTIEQSLQDPSKPIVNNSKLLCSIDKQLMELVDLLEDVIVSGSNKLNTSVLEKIEHLENQFAEIYKPNQNDY